MTRSSVRCRIALAVALAFVAPRAVSAKTVRITKTLDVVTKRFQVKKVSIDHPLGKLTIRGWDQQRVRITAVKIAPTLQTASRLRVHAELKNGRIDVMTRVLMKGQRPINAAMSKRLMKT